MYNMLQQVQANPVKILIQCFFFSFLGKTTSHRPCNSSDMSVIPPNNYLKYFIIKNLPFQVFTDEAI